MERVWGVKPSPCYRGRKERTGGGGKVPPRLVARSGARTKKKGLEREEIDPRTIPEISPGKSSEKGGA